MSKSLEFEKIYDKVIDACNGVISFASEVVMSSPDISPSDRARLDLMGLAAEELHNRAHEVEEHLAWDKIPD